MKKGDKIVSIAIIALLLISCSGVLYYKYMVQGSQRIAVIKKDGKIINSYDLKKVKGRVEIKIESEKNHFNVVEVEPNRIRILDADCPDKLCIKTGWISQPSQSVVCLPHKLMITIQGKNNSVDSVVY